jgi:hypothetical protein
MQGAASTLQAINVSQFVMLMAALSLGVERAVETLKGFIPPLGEPIQPPPMPRTLKRQKPKNRMKFVAPWSG